MFLYGDRENMAAANVIIYLSQFRHLVGETEFFFFYNLSLSSN